MKKNTSTKGCALRYANHALCPLNALGEGATARVKHLASTPELNLRLREMGIIEEQQIKMLARPSNIICQVCNTRLAISDELAGVILVEPLQSQPAAVPS